MPNKKTRRHKRKTHKRRYTKTNRRDLGKGMSPTGPVQCSMCNKTEPRNKTLVPAKCLMKHGERAHRVCPDCWWDPEIGFALEHAPHDCPGCKKGLPLTQPLKKKPIKEEDIIIISS